MRVVGIDGCRRGWVGVVLADRLKVVWGATIAEVVDGAGPVEVVGVDIPIGLPVRRPREADRAAQRFLGGRRSTVFATPVREALEAPTLAEGIRIARERTGAGISAQAYALRHRILEVDAWAKEAPVDVREVHPEVSFGVMAGGRPMAHPKRTWNGVYERVAALARAGIELPNHLGTAGAAAGIDDVVDAAAVAWTARRVAGGDGMSFPSPPEELDGWPAAIWA